MPWLLTLVVPDYHSSGWDKNINCHQVPIHWWVVRGTSVRRLPIGSTLPVNLTQDL